MANACSGDVDKPLNKPSNVQIRNFTNLKPAVPCPLIGIIIIIIIIIKKCTDRISHWLTAVHGEFVWDALQAPQRVTRST